MWELLKQYLRLVKTYQAGGDYRLDLGAEPVRGLPPVAGYDGCEEAAGAQVGGDYFLDPNAQHIAGQAEVVGYKQVPHHPPYLLC